jgi:signal recognition particle subunit SRP54
MLDRLTQKFTDIFRQITGKDHITQQNIKNAIEEIKLAFLEADVNLRVVRRFINHTTEQALGQEVLRSVSPGEQFVKIVYDRIVAILGDTRQDLHLKGPDTQSLILLLGLQGSGKTTTAAKLAKLLKDKSRKPLLVAADLLRPAAIEQLSILAAKVGVEIYKAGSEKSPSQVVRNALKQASRDGLDTVIVDTAGRLQIDEPLMQELRDIKKISNPDEVILVADAMTGQNAVQIAKEFDEGLGITGVVLSKFDSDTRGGAALSIKSVTGKAIKFIGTGERLEALEPFYPDRIASRILGMGDIVSLIEKAQETTLEEEAEELRLKIESKRFTLGDFLDQFKKVRKMGSLKSLMEMIPGFQGNIPEDSVDEKEMKRSEAIILSMTPEERQNHRIVGPSRRRRVARGSGTSVYEVNKLLKQFEKTRLMMRKATKSKKYQADILSHFGV